MHKILLSLVLVFISLSSFAGGKAHTWHVISSTNGEWHGNLRMINEIGSFVGEDGVSSIDSFSVSTQKPLKYGFIFDPSDDFDVTYTLTMTQDDVKAFTSKACVYVITAKGPAMPDIRPVSYNGAKCDYNTVHGVGEDFTVG